MGRGDVRSKKGKIARGSFGNARPKKRTKLYRPPVVEAPKEEAPAEEKKEE